MNKLELRAALKEVEDMIDNAGDYDDIEELENERQEIMRQLRTIKSSYDSENVVFRATTRGGKNFVEVIDTGTDFDRYEIKMNDSIDYSDTIKGVLAMLIHHSGWKSGMFDKIEFDDTGMSLGEQYLQIMKMINKEFGFLYKSPTGSRERQYYFDIIRFISQNIKNGTMSVEELIQKSKDALRAKGIMSSRRISSSQKGMENVVENTQYDDYHIDTRGMGILDVENIIEDIESRGNQAVLTVQCSDGSVQHTYFTPDSWREYKDAKNNSRAAITDVWITEVKPTYVRNSKMIKSGYDFINRVPDGINLFLYSKDDQAKDKRYFPVGNDWGQTDRLMYARMFDKDSISKVLAAIEPQLPEGMSIQVRDAKGKVYYTFSA